jgi:hypothetical protein
MTCGVEATLLTRNEHPMPNEPIHGEAMAIAQMPSTLDETANHIKPQHAYAGSLISVVAIGASAGGLEACQNFFDAMPQGHGLAFILVQHLDPTHPSLMVDLLANHTKMGVAQAEDGAVILAEHIYIIPPGTYLSVKAGALHLTEQNAQHGARLPFDFLLHSLARAYGARAQALILSGTGADGSLGLVSIKDQGGFVIAQAPEEATFDGMPRSAIATGHVDHVLRLADMPATLLGHARDVSLDLWAPLEAAKGDEPTPKEEIASDIDSIEQIIALLRQETPHDFTTYKPDTLHRRIQRRMALVGAADAKAYLALLQQNPAECRLLASDMLINVTAFFRDKKVFDLLESTIIPEIITLNKGDTAFLQGSAGLSHPARDAGLHGVYCAGCAFRSTIFQAGFCIMPQFADLSGGGGAGSRDIPPPFCLEARRRDAAWQRRNRRGDGWPVRGDLEIRTPLSAYGWKAVF